MGSGHAGNTRAGNAIDKLSSRYRHSVLPRNAIKNATNCSRLLFYLLGRFIDWKRSMIKR
jgi:hypothetical protein